MLIGEDAGAVADPYFLDINTGKLFEFVGHRGYWHLLWACSEIEVEALFDLDPMFYNDQYLQSKNVMTKMKIRHKQGSRWKESVFNVKDFDHEESIVKPKVFDFVQGDIVAAKSFDVSYGKFTVAKIVFQQLEHLNLIVKLTSRPERAEGILGQTLLAPEFRVSNDAYIRSPG